MKRIDLCCVCGSKRPDPLPEGIVGVVADALIDAGTDLCGHGIALYICGHCAWACTTKETELANHDDEMVRWALGKFMERRWGT